MKLIEVNNISFSYSHKDVLKDVSLSVKEGEILGILGPNGGGKSSLLKLIIGELKPASGSIELSSKNISYIPQETDYNQSFPLKVSEILSFYSKEEVDELFN